jgi:predicted PurR-regulated permease PerM
VGLQGLPHSLLWGVAAFLLHYIPFVGATGGIVAMTLVSLIHFDSAWYAFATSGLCQRTKSPVDFALRDRVKIGNHRW